MTELEFYFLLALLVVNLLLVLWLLFRKAPSDGKAELLAIVHAGNDKTDSGQQHRSPRLSEVQKEK